MIIGEIHKTVIERLIRAMDFSSRIAAGEAASLLGVVITNIRTGEDVTAAIIKGTPVLASNIVSFTVGDGVPGGKYLLSVGILLSNGEILEDHLEVLVA